jgi:hypothetical protein
MLIDLSTQITLAGKQGKLDVSREMVKKIEQTLKTAELIKGLPAACHEDDVKILAEASEHLAKINRLGDLPKVNLALQSPVPSVIGKLMGGSIHVLIPTAAVDSPLCVELTAVEISLPNADTVDGDAVALTTTFTCEQTGLAMQLFAKVKGRLESAELFIVVVCGCNRYHILIKIINWFDPLDPAWVPLTSCKASNFFGYYKYICVRTQRTPVAVWGMHPLCFIQMETNMPRQEVFTQVRFMVGAVSDLCIAKDVADHGGEILGAANPSGSYHIGDLRAGVASKAHNAVKQTRLVPKGMQGTTLLDCGDQSQEEFSASQALMKTDFSNDDYNPHDHILQLLVGANCGPELVLDICDVQLKALAGSAAACDMFFLLAQNPLLRGFIPKTVHPHAASAFSHYVSILMPKEVACVPGYWSTAIIELGMIDIFLRAVATLTPNQLAAKDGEFVLSAVRAGASEAVCAAAATMSTAVLAAKLGRWPQAAKRAGVNFAAAVNSLSPEALANKSGDYALVAIYSGASEAVCAAAATMSTDGLVAKGYRWVDAVESALRNIERDSHGQWSESQRAVMAMMSAMTAQRDDDLEQFRVLLAAEQEAAQEAASGRQEAPTIAWINPTSLDEAIEKYHAEPDRGKSKRQWGRYYINNNEIKKAARSLALSSIWWVGCDGMSQYIPPTAEQIRSW